jgi:hypothetical protein
MSSDTKWERNQEETLYQIPDQSDLTAGVTRPLPEHLPLWKPIRSSRERELAGQFFQTDPPLRFLLYLMGTAATMLKISSQRS